MITILGEIHSSKNSRQIHTNRATGKPFVAKSKASKADEDMLLTQLSDDDNKTHWKRMITGKRFPLYVQFRFTRKTKGHWDFANLVQGVADAMVKAGYLPDDDVEHFIPVYAGYIVDKYNPGVTFWVE